MIRILKRIAAVASVCVMLFATGCVSVNEDGTIDIDGMQTVTLEDLQSLVGEELPAGWDTSRIFQGDGKLDSDKILDMISDEIENGNTDAGEYLKSLTSADTATFARFETEDIDGNLVDQSIFKDYDITMVNVWATWCFYCVEEMPGISALYAELPENFNIITICKDADTNRAEAINTLTNVDAHFTTLKSSKDLESSVLKFVQGYPTTFFVNSKGEIVGRTQVGAPATTLEGVKSAYLDLMNKAFESINNDQ